MRLLFTFYHCLHCNNLINLGWGKLDELEFFKKQMITWYLNFPVLMQHYSWFYVGDALTIWELWLQLLYSCLSLICVLLICRQEDLIKYYMTQNCTLLDFHSRNSRTQIFASVTDIPGFLLLVPRIFGQLCDIGRNTLSDKQINSPLPEKKQRRWK